MNERNIEALRGVIEGFDGPSGYLTRESNMVLALATFLAERGVLVPSPLTEKQLRAVIWDTVSIAVYDSGSSMEVEWDDIPRWLERIAKGEA